MKETVENLQALLPLRSQGHEAVSVFPIYLEIAVIQVSI